MSNAAFAGGDRLTSLTGAVHLIDVEKCSILLGTGSSAEIPAAASFASVHHVPMISPGSTSVEYADKTLFPYLLRTVASDKLQFDAFVKLALNFGWRKLAGLVQQSAYGLSQLGALQASVSKGGLLLWGQVLVKTDTYDSLSASAKHWHSHANGSKGERELYANPPGVPGTLAPRWLHRTPVLCAVPSTAPSPWTS